MLYLQQMLWAPTHSPLVSRDFLLLPGPEPALPQALCGLLHSPRHKHVDISYQLCTFPKPLTSSKIPLPLLCLLCWMQATRTEGL